MYPGAENENALKRRGLPGHDQGIFGKQGCQTGPHVREATPLLQAMQNFAGIETALGTNRLFLRGVPAEITDIIEVHPSPANLTVGKVPDCLIEGADSRLQGGRLAGLRSGSVVGKLDFLENLVCLAHFLIPPQVMTALREHAPHPEWEMIALAFRFDQD